MGDSGKKDNPELIAALPFPSERDTAYKIGISAAAQITRKNKVQQDVSHSVFYFSKTHTFSFTPRFVNSEKRTINPKITMDTAEDSP